MESAESSCCSRHPSHDEIEALIKRTIVEILDLKVSPDEIGSTEPLLDEGLGVNSLAMIEAIVTVEERLGIKIPDEDLSRTILASVQSFADYLYRLCQSGKERKADTPER